MIIVDLLAIGAIVATFLPVLRFIPKMERLKRATERCVLLSSPPSRSLQAKVGIAAMKLWYPQGLKALKRQLRRAKGDRERKMLRKHIALLRCCRMGHMQAIYAMRRWAPWAMGLFILHTMLE